MKKIFITLLILVLAITCFSQTYPLRQPLGSPTTVITIAPNGAIKGIITLNDFTDTTALNLLSYVKYTPNVLVNVGNVLYMRNSIATAWIRVGDGTSGGGGIRAVYNGYGLGKTNDSTLYFLPALRDSIISLIPTINIANTQVAVGNGANSIAGTNNFRYTVTGSDNLLELGTLTTTNNGVFKIGGTAGNFILDAPGTNFSIKTGSVIRQNFASDGTLTLPTLSALHGASDSMLVFNPTSKTVGFRPIPAGTLTGATNGLSIVGSNVVLGGTLTGATTINTASFALNFTNLPTSDTASYDLTINSLGQIIRRPVGQSQFLLSEALTSTPTASGADSLHLQGEINPWPPYTFFGRLSGVLGTQNLTFQNVLSGGGVLTQDNTINVSAFKLNFRSTTTPDMMVIDGTTPSDAGSYVRILNLTSRNLITVTNNSGTGATGINGGEVYRFNNAVDQSYQQPLNFYRRYPQLGGVMGDGTEGGVSIYINNDTLSGTGAYPFPDSTGVNAHKKILVDWTNHNGATTHKWWLTANGYVWSGNMPYVTSADTVMVWKDGFYSAMLASNLPSGGGGVSSVAMSVPSFLSVSGSPITTSGTLAVTLSGTALPDDNGGTGQTTYTTGDILYASSSNTLSKLTIGSTNDILTVVAGVPAWAAPPAGSGTVTSFTFTDGSGFDGTVTSSTSTPTLSLTTTVSNTQIMYSNSGAVVGDADFTFNGTQLALGGSLATNIGFNFSPAVGGNSSFGFYGRPVLTPGSGGGLTGYDFGGVFNEFSSGSHGTVTNVALTPPTVNAAAGTITRTANLYVGGVMSATVTDDNYAIYVGNGKTFFGGSIQQITTGTTTASAPTPNADASNIYILSALAEAATFGAPTGTLKDGQVLMIRIKDNGTARALGWNAVYRAGTDIALPTTTVINKTMYLQFNFNDADDVWDLTGLTRGFTFPIWYYLFAIVIGGAATYVEKRRKSRMAA